MESIYGADLWSVFLEPPPWYVPAVTLSYCKTAAFIMCTYY